MASTASVATGFNPTSAVHPVDQVLPPERLAVYGLQHVLAFYAGAVIVPLLLAAAIGLSNEQLVQLISADLFTCGVASIIQSVGFWKVGVRLPLIQGVTFTAVAPMIAIGKAAATPLDGLLQIYGAVIIAGIVTFLIAPYYSRLLHLFPPVVTGTVITIIGVTLIPVAILSAGGGNPTAPDFESLRNLAFAAGTLVLILMIYRFFRGFMSSIAVLLGLVVGTAVAAAFGLVDFSGVAKAGWVGVTTPFRFGLPTFSLAAIVSMVVVMLITAVETTGDVFATGEIVGRTIRQDDIARALRADGLSTLLGGILNSFPYTCFAENIGLVRLTRVKSRFVVAAAGAIMIVLGLFPKIAALVAAIPSPVLGGAATILFATVAVVGIQTLSRVDFHEERNVIIVAVSLGLAMCPVAFPTFYKNLPSEWQIIVGNSITMGSLTAILLNIFFNVLTGKGGLVEEVTPTARLQEKMPLSQLNRLDKGEFIEKVGRFFQGGDWIAESAWEKRPFQTIYGLRRALQEAVFDAPPERQVELIRSYPDLGRMLKPESVSPGVGSRGRSGSYNVLDAMPVPLAGLIAAESLRDQSSAGLDRLSPEDSDSFSKLNKAYREKFGFPLVVCVRENTKETILASGKERLENSTVQEKALALIEIAKIANLRLQDLIEAPVEEAAVS
jgi:uric acid transporter